MPDPQKIKPLTPEQITALRALEKIHAGNPTTFLNWADADTLVKLGLAKKLGEGKYAITDTGLAALQQIEPSA